MYQLIQWPEIQEYIGEPWFDREALLVVGHEDTLGEDSYLIPYKYILDDKDPNFEEWLLALTPQILDNNLKEEILNRLRGLYL